VAAAAGPLESVIVADANGTQAALVRTMLRVSLGRGLELHTVDGAALLLEHAGRSVPGLVVLDYRLPGHGDGLETLRALRKLPGLGGLPAILVVARIEVDYVRVRLLPKTELLVRPIDRASLDAALGRIVPRTTGH
jgi:CheY-like chemotaxis protein